MIIKIIKESEEDSEEVIAFAASITTTLATDQDGGEMKVSNELMPNAFNNKPYVQREEARMTPPSSPAASPAANPAANPAASPASSPTSSPRQLTLISLSLEEQPDASNPMEYESDQEGPTAPAAPSEHDSNSEPDDMNSYLNTG